MAKTSAETVRPDSFTSSGLIQARISDFEHGLRVYDDLRLIRIKSTDYSLLIMEDYFPTIGRINGTVELVSDSDTVLLGKLVGYYLHRDNEFSLMVEEYLTPAEGAPSHEN